jgi:hypothetical protein
MPSSRILLVCTPLLATIACGGGGGASGTTGSAASIADATPSSRMLSVELANAPSTAMPSSGMASMMVPGGTGDGDFPPVMIGADGCHPHLFLRTEAVSRRLNRHLFKFLGRIDRLIAGTPTIPTSGQMVWEKVFQDGVDARFTIAKVADLTYSWTLELRQGTTGNFTTVFSGQIDRTGATDVHQGKGNLILDLTALHTVIPPEPATGTIQVAFDVTAKSRQVELDAADVAWDTVGDPDDLPPVAPRNAHYVYLSEKGTGGSLKAADQMIFSCPANPTLARADVELVHRWTDLADGSVHGRSDALMQNGQLTATQQEVGATCHSAPAFPTAAMMELPDVEGYWLMKLEDGGAVVAGSVQEAGSPSACDPVFGAVPAADSTANDFLFSAVNFQDSTPYPFPGMVLPPP